MAAVKAEVDPEPAQGLQHLSSGAEPPEAQQGRHQWRQSAPAGGTLQMAPAAQPAMAAGMQSAQSAQETIEGSEPSAAATCQLTAPSADAEEAQHSSAGARTQEPAVLLQADLHWLSADLTQAASSVLASMALKHDSAPSIGLHGQQDRPDVIAAQERAEGVQGSAAEQGFSQASTALYAAGTREHGPQPSLNHRHAGAAFSHSQGSPCTEQLRGHPSHSSGALCCQNLHSSGTPAGAPEQSHPVRHGCYALSSSQPGLVPLVCSSAGPSTSKVMILFINGSAAISR